MGPSPYPRELETPLAQRVSKQISSEKPTPAFAHGGVDKVTEQKAKELL